MRILDIIQRLQSQLAEIPGAHLYMQPVQDSTIDTRVSRTQYQYRYQCARSQEVEKWSDFMLEAELNKITLSYRSSQ